MTRLDDIESRWARATKGHWHVCDNPNHADLGPHIMSDEQAETVLVIKADSPETALAVATAPEDIAWLLARVRKMEKGLKDVAVWGRLNCDAGEWVQFRAERALDLGEDS